MATPSPSGDLKSLSDTWLDNKVDAEFVANVYRRLAAGPVMVDPAQPQGLPERDSWESDYWHPSSPKARELRADLSRDAFAEREGMRVTAILALGRITMGGDEAERFNVYRWLHEVMRLGESAADIYFPTFRCLDTATYADERSRRRDPYTHEVLRFIRDGNGRLRTPLKIRHIELMPQLARWLWRRYEFSDAAWLVRECWSVPAAPGRAPGPLANATLALPALMPRLVAACLVGLFAAGSQSSVWTAVDWVSSAWWTWALFMGGGTALLWILAWWEARRVAPLRASNAARASWIVLLALTYGTAGTSLVVWALHSASRGAFWTERNFDGGTVISPALVAGAMGLSSALLGYMLQLLWEDKPLTEQL